MAPTLLAFQLLLDADELDQVEAIDVSCPMCGMRMAWNDPMIVWIASFPRSGNTFMRIAIHNILGCDTYSIYNDAYDIAINKELSAIAGHSMLK